MIQLTLLQFFHEDFTDLGYELYFVKESGVPMYIGISRISVWQRWFGGLNSHMAVLGNDQLRGNSVIGEVIARRLPVAWDWTIELWTREDCINDLGDEIGLRKTSNLPLLDLEAFLIKKYMPLYNGMHRGGYHEDPLISKTLDEAYKKIFEGRGSQAEEDE